MEFTIIGGDFDKRRVWHNLFVHGDKLDSNGVPVARNIGLETLRRMVDSIHNLKGADMSPEAQQKRNIAGLQVLQGQEFSFLVGVEPAQNGYDAKNKMTVVLTPDNTDYVSGSGNGGGRLSRLLCLHRLQVLLVHKLQPQRLVSFRLGRRNSQHCSDG